MQDVEIGTIGENKVYIRLSDLVPLANKELKEFSDKICKENSRLLYERYIATETLRFYAEGKHIISGSRDFSRYDNADYIEGDVEDGHKAREALKEIEG